MKKNLVILIFFLFFILLYVCNIDNIPTSIILLKDEKLDITKLYGITIEDDEYITTSTAVGEGLSKNVNVNLCGITVKKINVTELPEVEVIPIGKLIGLKLYTNGVLVVGKNENISKEQTEIKEGDTIISINGENVDSIDALKKLVNKSEGKSLEIEYIRDNENILVATILPTKDENNEYKLGLWVKEGATGVGTISFYNPTTNQFAALGHGVYDKDTGTLLDIEEGEIVSSKIVSITKGEYGIPGEIRGTLEDNKLGVVTNNTEFGIYGTLESSSNVLVENSIEIASRDEIKEGEAYILCSLDNKKPEKYKINIEEIERDNNINNRSMKIKITDEKLIKSTGGIICGMSGCPVIQNNKLVGVITNVLVNNSEIGYAVFADLMLKEMVK